MEPEGTSIAEMVLFGVFVATLLAFAFLNSRLMKKVYSGHSAFSLYALSPIRLIDALKHAELYLMLVCLGFSFILVTAIFAKHGCGRLNEFPSFIKGTCALIAPYWAKW